MTLEIADLNTIANTLLNVIVFVIGAVFFIEGLAEAVNFMGDHKTSVVEKLMGAALAIIGVLFIGESIGLF